MVPSVMTLLLFAMSVSHTFTTNLEIPKEQEQFIKESEKTLDNVEKQTSKIKRCGDCTTDVHFPTNIIKRCGDCTTDVHFPTNIIKRCGDCTTDVHFPTNIIKRCGDCTTDVHFPTNIIKRCGDCTTDVHFPTNIIKRCGDCTTDVHFPTNIIKRCGDCTTDVHFPTNIIKRCGDCTTDVHFPTNIIIKRLRDDNIVITKVQAKIFPLLLTRRSLNHDVKHESLTRRQPLLGKLMIDRHSQSGNGLHGAILPIYGRVSISDDSATSKDSARSRLLSMGPRQTKTISRAYSVPSNKNKSTAYFISEVNTNNDNQRNVANYCLYERSLENFGRQFYHATFTKLVQISPKDRKENGVSFVQSALFVNLALMALSLEEDLDVKKEIDKTLQLYVKDTDKMNIIQHIISILPPSSSDTLKFRWSARLVLGTNLALNEAAAVSLGLKVDRINGSGTAEELTKVLNKFVEDDSGGAMRNTFEEEELESGVRAALISVVYLRARWRVAPTLLNGSMGFYDGDAAPRATRMLRINDVMGYADLTQWGAQAVEIPYATPGLSLIIVVPRGRSLKSLAGRVTQERLEDITNRMSKTRVAVTLPLFTLRMTLLLPSKFQAMQITRLVETNRSEANVGKLRLSHAVQRLMFWSEAGRNAFKDDGIEWDEAPQQKMMVDRPYVFFVRWHNLTLMSGNFVL